MEQVTKINSLMKKFCQKLLRKPGRFKAALISGLIFLAFWHFCDVRTAAAASGDSWLTEWYLTIAFLFFLGVFLLNTLFFHEGKHIPWPLEKIYPLAALLLGGLYLLVFPPLSAPDEISHYITAYELSSRMLGQTSNYHTGHVLVRGTDWYLEDVYGDYGQTEDPDGIWTVSPDNRQAEVLGQKLTERTYRAIHKEGFFSGNMTPQEQRLQSEASHEETLAVSSYPPVVTTPLAYVPQALGVSLARLLDGNSICLAYSGRLFNLLFFVLMTWAAMKRLPFGKEVLFGTAMLPMTLHLSASFSYDVMLLACLFYFTAVCLDLAYAKAKVTPGDVAVLMILMATAGPCKMVYAAMMGLCLLIPVKKFGNRVRWAASGLAVGGIWLLSMTLVNSQTIASYATEAEYMVPWAQEAGYSLVMLLHHPGLLVTMFYQTLLYQAEYYHLTMIGAYLGNLDTGLGAPYAMVVLLTGCLVCLSQKKSGEQLQLTGVRRIWVFVVCGICAALILFSMLIAWTTVSSPVIIGVQGRYFLPFLPALLMAFKNNWLILTKDKNRSILYLMFCINGYILLRCFSIVSLRL